MPSLALTGPGTIRNDARRSCALSSSHVYAVTSLSTPRRGSVSAGVCVHSSVKLNHPEVMYSYPPHIDMRRLFLLKFFFKPHVVSE